MKILLIGSGGREHALAWKLSQSVDCEKIYFAPGNGGTKFLPKVENVGIASEDIARLADFADSNADFTVVGPEIPLGLGVADLFRGRGLPVFAPDKNAARLETSKAYAKGFMKKYGVPTARYDVFDDASDALKTLAERKYPLWVKTDGLAAGKGAIICKSENEAKEIISSVMRDKAFGDAGERVVLEEHMEGRELTLMCFCDGETLLPMQNARDYQSVNDFGEGPNTGGMGCVSPVEGFILSDADEILQKTIGGIKSERLDYRGVLYIQLMLTKDGPRVIEYNARFGDPEAQGLLPLLETDLLSVMRAVEQKRLCDINLKWKSEASVCVVLASGGYPDKYQTGYPIELPEVLNENEFIFFAGAKQSESGALITNGGRVLAATALGIDAEAARRKAYELVKKISFKDMHYRKDVGL